MTTLPYDAVPFVKGLPLVGNLFKLLRVPLANAQALPVGADRQAA